MNSALAAIFAAFTAAALGRRAWNRSTRRYPKAPRRRDSDPMHIQEARVVAAAIKRVRRGLRFPTVQQKRGHFAHIVTARSLASK